jgi:hypothetical protein
MNKMKEQNFFWLVNNKKRQMTSKTNPMTRKEGEGEPREQGVGVPTFWSSVMLCNNVCVVLRSVVMAYKIAPSRKDFFGDFVPPAKVCGGAVHPRRLAVPVPRHAITTSTQVTLSFASFLFSGKHFFADRNLEEFEEENSSALVVRRNMSAFY